MLSRICVLSLLLFSFANSRIHSKYPPRGKFWELSGKFEGDIITSEEIPSSPDNPLSLKQISTWPSNTLVYRFSMAMSQEEQDNIENVMGKISNVSYIKFRRANYDDKDYVFITNGPGCISQIGYNQIIQEMNLQYQFCHDTASSNMYPIGESKEMTEKDIRKLNLMYNCPEEYLV